VFSLRTSYKVAKKVELFANVQNLFDKRYSTFGLFGDPTGVNAPGVPIVRIPMLPASTIAFKVRVCRARISAESDYVLSPAAR